jgi:hypothetical protein
MPRSRGIRWIPRVALALVLGTATLASAEDEARWRDRFEIHGSLTSRFFLRSPDFQVGDELQISSWRQELEIEPSLEVFEGDELRLSLFANLRPTYEGAYNVSSDLWGGDANGGAFGTGSAAFASAARRGQSFPGAGARLRGEFTLVNDDVRTLLSGVTAPGFVVDETENFGALVAPWAPRGSQQAQVGGDALAGNFLLRAGQLAGSGDPSLQNSLARASLPLITPLNVNAPFGAVGNVASLDDLPADVNATQSRLRWDCTDNSKVWCYVRELYADIEYKDTFVRLGRQQIVWGNMDAFRLQDIVNPIDVGYRGIFADLEDRRIPVLALDAHHALHTVGPLEDVNLEAVWVVDRFRPQQLGQCGEPYAPAMACELRAQASTHGATNLGIAAVDERDWEIGNTEPGFRMQFRLPEPSIDFSLSAFYGFQDLPVTRFVNPYSAANPNPAAMLMLQALGLGPAIDGLAGGGTPWTTGFDPYSPAEVAAANAVLVGVWDAIVAPTAAGALAGGGDPAAAIYGLSVGPVPAGTFPLLAMPWSGSEAIVRYPRVLTLGGSATTEIPGIDSILRLEMAWDFGRDINNTTKLDGIDESDVLMFAVGIDRDVFIPFVSPNRTATISFQTFLEHVVSYDGGSGYGDGMVVPENHVISTFTMTNRWFQDRLGLTTFVAYDFTAQALAFAPTLRWVMGRNWAVELGFNLLSGSSSQHNLRDLCASGGLDCLGTSATTWQAGQWQALNRNYQRTAEGPWWGQQSFADHFAEKRDEVWFGLTYQF